MRHRKTRRKGGKGRQNFWLVTGCLCFFFAAIMAGMAGRTLISYRSSEKGLEKMYEDIERLSPSLSGENGEAAGDTASAEPQDAGDPQGSLPKAAAEGRTKSSGLSYEALKGLNSDMIGWISIPDTVVDYPVMYTPDDPNFYFHRDFYKNQSSYGMIYMDSSCRLDGTYPNTILYGHHMRNGAMFATIEKYSSSSYKNSHPLIGFKVEDTESLYEVMAVVRISGEETTSVDFLNMLAARTEEEYSKLMQYLGERTLYQTGITAQWPEQLLTLTTCEYSKKDGRFLVIARKQ